MVQVATRMLCLASSMVNPSYTRRSVETPQIMYNALWQDVVDSGKMLLILAPSKYIDQ